MMYLNQFILQFCQTYTKESPQEDWGQFYHTLGGLKFSSIPGELSQMEGFKFSTLLQGHNTVFSTEGMEGVPPPLTKNYSSLPLGKVSPVVSPPPNFYSPQPTKFGFSIENIFFRVVSRHQKCNDL